ncbi:MAG TPA: CBS domain-containing protein, partial [Thermoplasmata archaeon]|nr:CBS domain-containing protein [Thermoplasmata archaeon]
RSTAGGVPVVDTNGRLIGILTEGDLIAETLAGEYRRAFGTSVGEVMTAMPVSVSPDTSLEDVAAVMRAHGVRVVPVLADDELVGVVSSADVIEGLVDRSETDGVMASDVELEREMRRRMQQEPWLSTRNILVQVEGGIVSLHGLADSEAERSALVTMARAIPGCRGVDPHLLLRPDVLRHYAT